MNKMDLKIYIDTDDDIRLSRRVLKLSRDQTKADDFTFLNDLLEKYEKYIKPNYEKYIEPTKKYADIIVPNYGFSTEETPDLEKMSIPAIDLIIKRVLPQD